MQTFESLITLDLIEDLYKSHLLWYVMAGLNPGMLGTSDNECEGVEIAKKIIELLPQSSIPEEERNKMRSFLLRDIIGALIFDIKSGY